MNETETGIFERGFSGFLDFLEKPIPFLSHAPWFTIPSDDKSTARYIVAKIIYDTLKSYTDIDEPELDDDIKANLEEYKRQLESE